MMFAPGWATEWMISAASFTSNRRQVGSAGDVEQNAARTFDRRFEEGRGDGGAGGVGGSWPSPMDDPIPMIAEPALIMTIFTSAKSVLINPGTLMRSVMLAHALHENLIGHPWKALSMLVLSVRGP